MCVLWCLVFSDKRCAESSWITAAETWGDKNILSGNTDSAYYILRSLFSQDDPNSFQEIDKKKKKMRKRHQIGRLVMWGLLIYRFTERNTFSRCAKKNKPFPQRFLSLYIINWETAKTTWQDMCFLAILAENSRFFLPIDANVFCLKEYILIAPTRWARPFLLDSTCRWGVHAKCVVGNL